jgi:hypothetical protein
VLRALNQSSPDAESNPVLRALNQSSPDAESKRRRIAGTFAATNRVPL